MTLQRCVSTAALIAAVALGSVAATAATIIPVQEDVMASAFFFAPNHVRGYAGDDRDVHRVASDNAFGTGPETVYLSFDPGAFSGFSAPVASALLTMESADGGFGANAGPGSPFTVSAHGVDTDPLAAITDDTNPSGPIGWLDFFGSNILPADPAALTSIDGFGTVTFDVTALVNDWVSGANTVFSVALTGKNDASGSDYLHGFLNNTENPGSTFLTVAQAQVPEPASIVCLGLAVATLAGTGRGARVLRAGGGPAS